MAGNEDLFTALNMFKQGVQDLSFSRAVAGANDQVQQIKSSEMNQQQQRAALSQLSNQLVGQLATTGAPADKIAMIHQAIAPKQFANANAMNTEAQLTGDTGLADEAKQAQDFENNKAFTIQQMKMKSKFDAQNNPMAKYMAEQKMQEQASNDFGKFGTYLNPNANPTRVVFGQMGLTGNKGDRLHALLGDPNQFATLGNQDASLLGEGLVNMVKGGVATEHEMQSILPDIMNKPVAEWKTYLTNNPAALNAPGVFQKLQSILDKESMANKNQIADEILKRATEKSLLSKMQGGKYADHFKMIVARELSPYSDGGVKPEDVVITPSGVTTTQMQALEHKGNLAEQYIKQAYLAAHSKDPKAQADSAQVFQTFGINPLNTTMQDAVKSVRGGLRAGRFSQ